MVTQVEILQSEVFTLADGSEDGLQLTGLCWVDGEVLHLDGSSGEQGGINGTPSVQNAESFQLAGGSLTDLPENCLHEELASTRDPDLGNNSQPPAGDEALDQLLVLLLLERGDHVEVQRGPFPELGGVQDALPQPGM